MLMTVIIIREQRLSSGYSDNLSREVHREVYAHHNEKLFSL